MPVSFPRKNPLDVVPSSLINDIEIAVEAMYPAAEGDLMIGGAGGTAARLAVGAAGTIVVSDGVTKSNKLIETLIWRSVKDPRYGAVGDGVADDTVALQAALTAGGAVFFPKPNSYYRVTAALTVPADTTIILAAGTIIEQVTKDLPVFDILLANGVTIEGNGALLRYTGSRAYTSVGTVRGGAQYTYGAGVYAAANRTAIRHLRVEGFTSGVYLSAWNGAAKADYQWQGNLVENLQVAAVDFGVLFDGQSDLTLTGISGTYAMQTGSPNAPHLIYGSAPPRNRNVVVSDCEAWDGPVGHAYQFKGVDGGACQNLTARNCVGLLAGGTTSDAGNTDLSFSNIVGRDLATTGINGQIQWGQYNHRTRMDGVTIHNAGSDRSINIDGVDNVMSNVTIRSRHDTTASTHDVIVKGTRTIIDGISILNLQDDGTDYTTAWRAINIGAGTDCVVRPLLIRNVAIAFDVLVGAVTPKLDLSGAKVVLASVGGQFALTNASTTLRIVTGDNLVAAAVGDVSKTLVSLVDETTQVWNAPLTAVRTAILSTTNAYRGARFRIVRTAAATGASALNVGTGPLKALATGQWCEVEYDGSAWLLTAAGSL